MKNNQSSLPLFTRPAPSSHSFDLTHEVALMLLCFSSVQIKVEVEVEVIAMSYKSEMTRKIRYEKLTSEN
jgi:hypothetical protein